MKSMFNLYGKPSERLILVGLCEKYGAEFKANETTGVCTIDAEPDTVQHVRETYYKIIGIAYRALAFAQARNDLAKVPVKTLHSEFMSAFATWTYSLYTGKTVIGAAGTESARAGLKAVQDVEEWPNG